MDQGRQRALEDQLALEYVQAERLRATLMAVGFSIGFVLTIAVYLFLKASASRAQNSAFLPISPIISEGTALAAIYCWLSRHYVNRKIARGQALPRLYLILNSLIEVSGVSLVLLLMARASSPAFALSAPPVLLYLAVTMVSILRLDERVSLFVALVATVQYVALAKLLLPQSGVGPLALFLSPFPIYLRSGILAVSGLGAATISRALRHRIIRAAEVVVERDRTMAMFGQHVSPQVAERLLAEQAGQVTELRQVTVLFLDIRDFTRFSESRTPSEVVAFLNTLFAPLVAVVDRHGGIINKFLGDGFLAVFGAPLPAENHCLSAVRAALDLQAEVLTLTRTGQIPPTRIGIGLHAGDVITGSVGSSLRREYTVIGDTVNLASRIEQLTKVHNAQILASEAVIAQLPPGEYPAKRLPAVTVKGREAPVVLFQLA